MLAIFDNLFSKFDNVSPKLVNVLAIFDNVFLKFENKLSKFLKGMVNCQNLRDKGPPECNSAPG